MPPSRIFWFISEGDNDSGVDESTQEKVSCYRF